MNKVISKYVPFLSFIIFLPSVFMAPVVGTFFLSPVALLIYFRYSEFVKSPLLGAIYIIQPLIFCAIMYFIVSLICKRTRLMQNKSRNIVSFILVFLAIVISFLPVYGFEGGESLYLACEKMKCF